MLGGLVKMIGNLQSGEVSMNDATISKAMHLCTTIF